MYRYQLDDREPQYKAAPITIALLLAVIIVLAVKLIDARHQIAAKDVTVEQFVEAGPPACGEVAR